VKAPALVAALMALSFGAVACKKDAEPAKAASTEQGGGGESQAGARSTSADHSRRNPALPPAPRRLGDGTLAPDHNAEGEGRRGAMRMPDGSRDRAAMAQMRDERRKQALEMYDADKNGELDDTERETLRQARVADRIARMDSDADGKLSKAEMEASMSNRRRPPPDFDSIDTDHDGFVTVEEMAAARPPPMRGRGMPPTQ
jgi:hypothetical protein